MGFDTPNQGDDVLESGDVDHQQTTNRTHSGDSITPQSVITVEAEINKDGSATTVYIDAGEL